MASTLARIETLFLATLRLLERRTCAGDCPRFVSAVLELHCTSAAGEQWIRLWSKSPEGGGRKDGPTQSHPGTWMPAPHGAGFALPGHSKGKHERTYVR